MSTLNKEQIEVKESVQINKQSVTCPEMTKQSTLDLFIGKTFSTMSTSSEDNSTVKSSSVLSRSRKSGISSAVESTETKMNPIQQSTKTQVITNPTTSGRIATVETHPSNYECLAKSNEPITSKSSRLLSRKKISVSALNSSSHTDTSDEENDSLFEDYFTSSNCPSKPKVVFAHSSTKAFHLPSLELKPKKSQRCKSQSHKSFEKRQKHIDTNDRIHHQEAPGRTRSDQIQQFPASNVSSPEAMSMVSNEFKFDEAPKEPVAKRQRRKTKQIVVTLMESKDDLKLWYLYWRFCLGVNDYLKF